MFFKIVVFLASVLFGFDDEFSCEQHHPPNQPADAPNVVKAASVDREAASLTCLRSKHPTGASADLPQEPVTRHLLFDRDKAVIYIDTSDDPFHAQIEHRTQSILFPAGAMYGPMTIRDGNGRTVSVLHACRLFVGRNQMQCGYFSRADGSPISTYDFKCFEGSQSKS